MLVNTKSMVKLRNEILFWSAAFDPQWSYKRSFTNYVYKRRGVGGPKNRPFANFYTIENVSGGG